jgi:hypothetical protein
VLYEKEAVILIITTSIFGFLGIVLFVVILISFQKLLANNESGFLHLLMSIMFICWLPIPFVIYTKMGRYDFLLIGTIFGTFAILFYILTMLLQAGHLTYSSKMQDSDIKLWEGRDEWMLNGLLGGQVELMAGMLKGVWSIFLTVSFWLQGHTVLFMLGIIYSTLTFFYLSMLLDMSINKKISFLKKLKLSTMIINLENASWFTILLIWLIIG